MATPAGPLEGDALLTAVTDAMVVLHERYYQRPPLSAKTRMMGEDLLACVLGGVYTEVEKTLTSCPSARASRRGQGRRAASRQRSSVSVP